MAGYTEQDLARVRAAITKGELSVQYADKRIQYRSIAELERAAQIIERNLERSNPAPRSIRLRHGGKGAL